MKIALRALAALLFVVVAAPCGADEYSFVTLRLPHGIQIDMPRTWRSLNKEENALIATARDAALDLSGLGLRYTGDALFAANSMPPTTYASLRVSLDPSMAASPQDLSDMRAITESDLRQLESMMQSTMDQVLSQQGMQILDSLGIAKEAYGDYPALSYRYRRSSQNGPVIVDLIQIYRPDAAIRINLAYREAEAQIWSVVIRRIKQSILIN